MADSSNSLNKAQAVWQQVRSFVFLWLALICLGGFVVLVGGPWVIGFLKRVFGPAAGLPGRVIAIDMLITLPLAVYLWTQQRKLDEQENPLAESAANHESRE